MRPAIDIWPFWRPLPFTQNLCATTAITLPSHPFYISLVMHEKQTAYDTIYDPAVAS